ncbi:MAG: DNA primase [Clostridia bacterium]|nr:DNA primase [Clostridia bacterium]
MAIDPKFIEQLKDKNDIVDVVSRYCTLQQRGGSFWACCPLPGHTERTPSFSANQNGQFYKCFGCGRGGDSIKFIMEMESMTYPEAVKLLAEWSNMELPDDFREERRTNDEYRKKETYLSILRDTAKFYVSNLRSGRATEHEEYIAKRGLSRETVTTFGIGASLDFDSLPEFLRGKGYKDEDMVAAGVVTEKETDGKRSIVDFEAKRLVFPTINALGEVIAFCGRVMWPTDFQKYKNTRETMLFSKSKALFNINNIKKQKAAGPIPEIIIVEGQMDAVSLFSAGFKNVVASMGTSLTRDQAKLVKRYTENVLISYDGDFAGQKANIRGLEILSAEGLNVKVVALPDGMDPDDVIKKMGADEYRKMLDGALPLVDFKLKILKDKFYSGDKPDRRRYISEALKVLRADGSESEREELLRRLSKETGITFQALSRDLEKAPISQKNEQKTADLSPADSQKSGGGRLAVAERFVLARALVSDKKPLPGDLTFEELRFTDPHRMEIAAYVSDFLSSGLKLKPSLLYEYMSDEDKPETAEVISLIGSPALEDDAADIFFSDCVKLIKTEAIKSRIERLKLLAEKEEDADRRGDLLREIIDLNKQVKAL